MDKYFYAENNGLWYERMCGGDCGEGNHLRIADRRQGVSLCRFLCCLYIGVSVSSFVTFL